MDPNSQNPIVRMLMSSKALVVLLITIATFVGLYLGKAQWTDVESFLKYILITWLGSQGIEDAAKHFAQPKTDVVKQVATDVATDVVKSLAPPPPDNVPPTAGG